MGVKLIEKQSCGEGLEGQTPVLGTELGLREATADFLRYLSSLRRSPHTITAYGADLKVFGEWLARESPYTSVGDITRGVILSYLTDLRGAPATVRRRLSTVGSLFNYLVDMGHVPSNPTRRIPLPKLARRIPRALSREEAQRLIGAAHRERDRVILIFLLNTGLRREELARLRVQDVDMMEAQVRVRGKGEKERLVPLNGDCLRVLGEFLSHTDGLPDDPLFRTVGGKPLEGRRLYGIVTTAARAAGLEGVTPHTLRRTLATLLAEAGVSLDVLQEILGHASVSTTRLYIDVTKRRTREAMERLVD